MSVYKDNKTGTWRVLYRYTDLNGERKQTSKRGFATKKEATLWEREQMLKQDSKLDMTFASFYEIYEHDKRMRVKENTWESKVHIARTKILPYFGKRKLDEIEPKDVIAWQNIMMKAKDSRGKSYSENYLKTVHSQARAGTMGSEHRKEMLFWTKEEYLKFAEAVMDKPISYYAFELLYWSGIRLGELLALTPADFDFEKSTLTINKSYQRLKGKDVITSPKTPKSNRTIKMPKHRKRRADISDLKGLSASRNGQGSKEKRGKKGSYP